MKKILFVFAVMGLFAAPRIYAQVSVGVRIGLAPPPLPVYVQPACPVDGYLWEPGYWAYDDPDGYYWVPGVWIAPPDPGLLWTPCYWGFDDGFYVYHAGYWGPHVGFYGGINYGFGYPGFGFYGGIWSGRSFRYNTAVFNVNRTVIHNTYVNRAGIHPVSNSRASFNGRGGVNAQPRAEDRRAMAEHHVQPTRSQMTHQQTAAHNPAQHNAVNHGRPATSAMNRVNARSANQQGRVANGIKSGHMTAGEASHVEGHAANVNHEVRTERHANGGALTQPERQHVNTQQNNISRAIHNDNHNANNAPRQPRMEQQPQQHMEQPRPQPQQRAEQPRMGGGGGEPPHGGGGGGEHMGGGGAPHGGGGGGGGHERR